MSKFWNLYARSYDTATMNFSAYIDLLEAAVAGLQIQSGSKILNAGCGTGNIEKLVLNDNTNFEWIGGDISEGMLQRAKTKVRDKRFKFIKLDLNNKLPFDDSSFDIVVAIHSLYTVNNPAQTILEFSRLLKPGGKLVLINPKKGAKMSAMFKYEIKKKNIISFALVLLKAFPALIINLIIAKKANNKTFHFLSQEALVKLVEENNMQVVEKTLLYADQSIFLVCSKKSG